MSKMGYFYTVPNMGGTRHNKDNQSKPNAKLPDKLTDSEKKKNKQKQKADANPALAASKLAKNNACRERRAATGSSKSFA